MANQTKNYDAIIVGGGHNGLTNGAYLAKAGLKTLIIERRAPGRRRGDHRGAASRLPLHHVLVRAEPAAARHHPRARPGQARLHADPDAVVVRADGERRLPAARARTATRTSRRSCGTRRTTPTRWTATSTTSSGSARWSSRCSTRRRRTSSASRRRTSPTSAELLEPPQRRRAEGHARPGPAAHRQRRRLPRRLLRERHPQGLHGLVRDHRHQGRPDVAGLRPGAAVPLDGRARRPLRLVGVPQGRQRRLHPGAGPGGAGVRRRDPARLRRRLRHHQGRPGHRRRARRRHRVQRPGRGQRARPAAHVHPSWSSRASCRATWSRTSTGYKFQGTSAKVNFALDGLPQLPGARRPHRPVPRLRQHRPVDGVPRAGLRRRQVRLVQQAAVHRRRDPVGRRPGHGASRQARDELLRPVRAVPPQGQRLGHRARPVRRHRAGARWSRSSPASATWCCTARS